MLFINSVLLIFIYFAAENKTLPAFETAISTLQRYAATQGFEEEDFELLTDIIVKINTS